MAKHIHNSAAERQAQTFSDSLFVDPLLFRPRLRGLDEVAELSLCSGPVPALAC